MHQPCTLLKPLHVSKPAPSFCRAAFHGTLTLCGEQSGTSKQSGQAAKQAAVLLLRLLLLMVLVAAVTRVRVVTA